MTTYKRMHKQMWYIHRVEYYQALRRDVVTHATRMSFENTVLSGISPPHRILCMTPLMCRYLEWANSTIEAESRMEVTRSWEKTEWGVTI